MLSCTAMSILAVATRIRTDPRFEEASVDLVTRILSLHERHKALFRLVADQGQFSIIAQVYLFDPHVTASMLLRSLPPGIVSENRVEQQLATLARLGVLEAVQPTADRRERPLRLTATAQRLVAEWVDAIVLPGRPWATTPVAAVDDAVRRDWIAKFAAARRLGLRFDAEAPHYGRLTHLRGGNLILAELLLCSRGLGMERRFSAKGFATRLGLTRSQVQTLLAYLRGNALVEDGETGLQLAPAMRREVDHWNSCHLACSTMSIDGTLLAAYLPPGAQAL